jgi:hypothetical protein
MTPGAEIGAPGGAGGCEDGIHDQVVAGEPQYGGAVNIDHHCARCGKRLWVESWTREAWEAEQVKRAKKAGKQQLQGATSPEPRD